MESIELEESIEMRCTLYEQFAYETGYLSMPCIASLSDEERRKEREQDKEDFLDWLWLSPLARGLAGDVGLDELDRLRKFAEANRLDCGRARHDYKKLEEAIKDAVEDDLLIPVIDRTDDWGGGYLPAPNSQAIPLTDGLLRTSDTPFARRTGAFGDGEPILSGPYDPAMQEAKLKAARVGAGGSGSAGGGFDWLGIVEAVADATPGVASSREDDGGDSMLGSLRDADGGGRLAGDALPFEYRPESSDVDASDVAGVGRGDMYACDIISAECKGSILREFPGQYLNSTYNDIQGDARDGIKDARKALKLLDDNRFKK